MTAEMIALIDAWIAVQPGHVSRQEAVRRCVEIALAPAQRKESLFPEKPGIREPRISEG